MIDMARVSLVVGVLMSVILVGGVSAASADLREIVMFADGTPLAVQKQVVALSGGTVLHTLSLIKALAVRTNDQGLAVLKSKVQGVCNPLLDSLCVVAGVYDDLLTRVDSICPILTPPPPLVCLPEVDCYPEGTREIEADYAHEQFPLVRGAGVKVAIVGTGISPHQEFDHLDSGVNALSIDNPEGPPLPPVDNHGQGTAMAGTVGADLGLLPGIVGVAPKVTLVPVKSFDYKGEGYLSDIVNAFQWVRDNDISVVSTSFGVPVDSPVLKDAVKSLYDRGVIQVAARRQPLRGPKNGRWRWRW
jgi:Subtilase family